MKKAFSSMKSCPNKQKNEVNINNEDFLRTFVILDNLAQKQKVKVFYQKQTNSLVLKAEDPNIQTKKVKIDKNCSPVEFFELYQKNVSL